MKQIPSFVPLQDHGKAMDLFCETIENNQLNAIAKFNIACNKLLAPYQWKKLSGAGKADFAIVDPTGQTVQRDLAMGDFIRIDIPGPGNHSGGGYDWVQVISLQADILPDATESFGLIVTTAANPLAKEKRIAHFFDKGATSSFVVGRKDLTVTCSYHGRNEVPNISHARFPDNLRNSLVALGAMVGFSFIQWKELLTGLLGNCHASTSAKPNQSLNKDITSSEDEYLISFPTFL